MPNARALWTSKRAASLAAGCVLVVSGLLVWQRRRQPAIVDSQASCETIRRTYQRALASLQTCSSDDECLAEAREGVHASIDGCVRFRRRDADLAARVDPLDAAWLSRGCAQRVMTCAPRRAQCSAGVCTELPPETVPASWRRTTYTTALPGAAFSFFAPPDLVAKELGGDDGERRIFDGPRYNLVCEYGGYAPSLEADGDESQKILKREEATISGQKAILITKVVQTGARDESQHGRILAGVHFPDLPSARSPTQLTIWASCAKLDDCKDLPTIGRTVEFH